MKKLLNFINYTGLFAFPFFIFIGVEAVKHLYPDTEWTILNIMKLCGISLFICFLIFVNNNIKK